MECPNPIHLPLALPKQAVELPSCIRKSFVAGSYISLCFARRLVPHEGHPGGYVPTMAFIPVGDPQSMLITAIGVAPSTEFGGKE